MTVRASGDTGEIGSHCGGVGALVETLGEQFFLGETLDKFIENVVNGNDVKKEIRKEYIEKYCLNYPNGKTPCENIVNAILGQKEYKQIFTTTTL